VDDLVDAAESLAALLRLAGHDVRTAHDGESALAQALEFEPQVVLLDLAMPRVDGFSVAGRLRQLPGMQNVCLIAISGYGRECDIAASRRAGFDAHLLKPVELHELEAAIAQSCASS
jgi:two-component system CheB/CheR fusion protein